jgi:hypothetical protein
MFAQGDHFVARKGAEPSRGFKSAMYCASAGRSRSSGPIASLDLFNVSYCSARYELDDI